MVVSDCAIVLMVGAAVVALCPITMGHYYDRSCTAQHSSVLSVPLWAIAVVFAGIL